MKRHYFGYIIIIVISMISYFLSQFLKPFLPIEMITITIALSILIKLKYHKLKVYEKSYTLVSKHFLKIGIVLLGFSLSFKTLTTLGKPTILFLSIWIAFVILLSLALGKLFKLPQKLAMLIGIGSSICGASAIVTLAPIIDAKEEEKILAVSVISILGTIGVFFFSLLALLPVLSETQFGVYAGLSLHGVGHAIAAAFSNGPVSGEIGTIIKMTRVLYIIPLALILNVNKTSKKVTIPYYVFLFVGLAFVNSYVNLPAFMVSTGKTMSKIFILFAMTAMGLKVDFKTIKAYGKKTLHQSSLLFMTVLLVGFLVVQLNWFSF